MMKKLLCFLVILFLVPAAYAQETSPYLPGTAAKALFTQAFDRGDMLVTEANWTIDFGEHAPDLLGSDSATLDMLSEILRCSTLTVGAGKIENGLRIPLEVKSVVGDEQAALDLTLDLSEQGVSVTSSLLPGEQLTANWDTLLQLCGVSPEQLAPLQTLNDADMEAALAELTAQLAPMIQVFGQIAAPYGQTILTHVAALPCEVLENVPAEGDFPAAATEINLTITAKALGDLLIELSSQLEADTTLCALLDSALVQSGESITTAQLCEAIRSAAAEELTDESLPLYLCIGLDETEAFSYLSAAAQDETGEAFAGCLILSPDAGDPARTKASAALLTMDAAGNIVDGFDLTIAHRTPTNALPIDLQGELSIFSESAAIFAGSFSFSETAVADEQALRGCTYLFALSLDAADGDEIVSMQMDTSLAMNETADGGEKLSFIGDIGIAAGDMQLPLTFAADALVENTQDGPIATVSSISRMQPLGIEEFTEHYKIYAADQMPDPIVTTTIALETASAEELEALAQRAAASLESMIADAAETPADAAPELNGVSTL